MKGGFVLRINSANMDKKLETIFDHGVTKKEIKILTGFSDLSLERDLKDWSQQSHYALLFRLYGLRGDMEKAYEFANKIQDSEYRLFSLLNHDYARDLTPEERIVLLSDDEE